MRKILAAAGALALAALVAVGAAAQPAAAIGVDPMCFTVLVATNTPFVSLAADGVTETDGSAAINAPGVRLVTPSASSKVYGYKALSPEVTLKSITGAGFANTNHAGVYPSYQFGLKVNGAWGGTLAWESAYQSDGMKATTDVIHGGAAQWYITKSYGTYTAHTLKTWAEIVALLPADTTATYYGINQGAGNAGADNTIDALRLVYTGKCVIIKWSYLYPHPSGSASASASPSAVKTSSAPPPASPSGPVGSNFVTPTLAAVTLPVTGPGVGAMATLGAVLVAAGIVGIVVSRRRRRDDGDEEPQFVAE